MYATVHACVCLCLCVYGRMDFMYMCIIVHLLTACVCASNVCLYVCIALCRDPSTRLDEQKPLWTGRNMGGQVDSVLLYRYGKSDRILILLLIYFVIQRR